MAVPKQRHSKARGAKRRTHWKLHGPGLVACPQCHKPKLQHRICPSCGFYRGSKVLEQTAE
ncbi:MAG: 50S ribosomal protein L32 [Firmicutes bacterium]|nr:50S ribosomal protein L32 [Bacillota bacterium]HOB23049.1 50S ribosomal protein L32 [Bacillota bacterium]HQD39081.1 50S ribosomal protein L32 [Bacillota bacterium]